MIKLLINGINGRMGQEVLKEVQKSDEFLVVAGISRNLDNNIIPVYSDPYLVKEKVDVIIDFSSPKASMKVLEYAKDNGLPIIIATTGFTEDELKIIDDYSKYIPIFKSSNMSYEINLMSEIISILAKKILESDIEIIETHHRNKIDSPSGTALMLADSIKNSLNDDIEYVYDRHLLRQKRGDKEIGISSIRGGSEVGRHTVMFLGENESLEITHNVTSRNVFARGALMAAKFILSMDKGLYNMKDLIG